MATAALEWRTPTLSFGKAKNYIVLYKLSQPSKYWNVVRTNGSQVFLKSIQPKTQYTVRVLVLTTSNITYESQIFTLETGIGTSLYIFIFRFRKSRYNSVLETWWLVCWSPGLKKASQCSCATSFVKTLNLHRVSHDPVLSVYMMGTDELWGESIKLVDFMLE